MKVCSNNSGVIYLGLEFDNYYFTTVFTSVLRTGTGLSSLKVQLSEILLFEPILVSQL